MASHNKYIQMVCLHVVPKTEKEAGKFKIDKSVCCTDSPNYSLDLMTSDSNQSKGDFFHTWNQKKRLKEGLFDTNFSTVVMKLFFPKMNLIFLNVWVAYSHAITSDLLLSRLLGAHSRIFFFGNGTHPLCSEMGV